MTLSQIEQLKTTAFEVFQWLTLIGNHKAPIEIAALEKFFSPDIKMYRNGSPAYMGFEKVLIRLAAMQNKVLKMKFSIKDMLVSEDKVIVRYQITAIDTKEKSHEIFAFAILQIQDDKVLNWWEVLHEQGTPSSFLTE